MATAPTTGFDVAALSAAIQARDADAQLALYDSDATIELIDAEHGPSAPQVVRGADEIGAYLRDVTSRDLEHRVEHALTDGSTIAFDVACRYADGMRVRCQCFAELRDGRISRQVVVQAWDA